MLLEERVADDEERRCEEETREDRIEWVMVVMVVLGRWSEAEKDLRGEERSNVIWVEEPEEGTV